MYADPTLDPLTNKLVVPLTLETAMCAHVFILKEPPVITLEPFALTTISPLLLIEITNAISGFAVLKSNIVSRTVIAVGRMNASTAKSPVPKPKSDDVANDKSSPVPSNKTDAVPNFFCAVDN